MNTYSSIHNSNKYKLQKIEHGNFAKRGQQILRITREAESQATLLTIEDLATLLDCDEKTIRTDIKRLKVSVNSRPFENFSV